MTEAGILIICYAFPPYPGIGGRRWAKFSTELHKRGYKVHVIASENPFTSKSSWTEETRIISQTRLPLKYPKALILFPPGLLGKLKYKIGLAFVKLWSRGNYFDRTIFWERSLKVEVKKRVKELGYRYVIITGAPFHLFRFGAELKKELPESKFIADIRDPWTNNQSAYGFGTISSKRFKLEQEWEKSVFKNYDGVISVNEAITQYFQSIYSLSAKKFITIPNGYDPNEMDLLEDPGIEFDPKNLNLLFAGSFYENAVYLYDNLIKALLSLIEIQPRIHFYFYGPNAEWLKVRTPKSIENYFTFGWVDNVAKVNSMIKAADFGMLFLTDDINNSFSTKFCEYIKYRKPIILFARPGETSEYITNLKIGIAVSPGNELEAIEELLKTGKRFEIPMNFKESDYAIPSLTDKLEELLE